MEQQGSKDQTTLADVAPTPAKKKPEPIVLGSPHYYQLVARALVDRADVLKKLAKDARQEDYTRQAADFEADAGAIEGVLLPQFRMQRELPLVDGEKFEKACGEALRGLIYQAFSGMDDPKQKLTPDAIERRRDRLARDLGVRIATFAREIAGAAYTHGYQVRTTNSDVIAAGQLRILGGAASAD